MQVWLREIKLSHVVSGMAAVIVGYSSSVVLVIQAAQAAGANAEQLSSWLFVLGLGMGLTSICFSLICRMPIFTAWSTPGAVLLAGQVADFSLAEVIGSFMVSALLILLCGLSRQLSRLVERIPSPLAAAMLAGVLLRFVLGAFSEFEHETLVVVALLAGYLIGRRFLASYTMLLLLGITLAAAICTGKLQLTTLDWQIGHGVWISPQFSLQACISLALPLFLVTMVSQNLPGIALLHSHGYRPSIPWLLRGLGGVNLLLAPFGGFAYNLAAISAAICMGEEAGEEPKHRYWAAVWGGIFYLVTGIFSAVVVALFVQLPDTMTLMLAGFALIGTFNASLTAALQAPSIRESALITFLITASGATLFGLGSTFWGLLGGAICLWGLDKRQKKQL